VRRAERKLARAQQRHTDILAQSERRIAKAAARVQKWQELARQAREDGHEATQGG
ncbi:MAG: hypothetical protein JOZ41_20915, partial [Chloroflexi bacterium]|nr:hypothetical protein [Chloroflexota bacterium]